MQHQRAVEVTGRECVFLLRGKPLNMRTVLRTCKRAREPRRDGIDGSRPKTVECMVIPDGLAALADTDAFECLRNFLHHTAVHFD